MKKSYKITLGVICLTPAVVFVMGIALYVFSCHVLPVVLIGSMGSATVVESAVSPDGVYRAELINVDQGALGGDTVIKVLREESSGRFWNDDEIIYMGQWGEFDYMDLSWEDCDTLVVYDSKHGTYTRYEID